MFFFNRFSGKTYKLQSDIKPIQITHCVSLINDNSQLILVRSQLIHPTEAKQQQIAITAEPQARSTGDWKKYTFIVLIH